MAATRFIYIGKEIGFSDIATSSLEEKVVLCAHLLKVIPSDLSLSTHLIVNVAIPVKLPHYSMIQKMVQSEDSYNSLHATNKL